MQKKSVIEKSALQQNLYRKSSFSPLKKNNFTKDTLSMNEEGLSFVGRERDWVTFHLIDLINAHSHAVLHHQVMYSTNLKPPQQEKIKHVTYKDKLKCDLPKAT